MTILEQDRELAGMIVELSLLRRDPERGEKPFILASGKPSWHYFECQRTTASARALPLLGASFLARLQPEVQSVGGLTRGADPIATAIACCSGAARAGSPVDSFSVRKNQKDHGTERWIEGWGEAGTRIAIVDDVVTSGGSVILAIDRCRSAGLDIRQVIVLVDRQEGGMEKITTHAGSHIPVTALFTMVDLLELERSPAAGAG